MAKKLPITHLLTCPLVYTILYIDICLTARDTPHRMDMTDNHDNGMLSWKSKPEFNVGLNRRFAKGYSIISKDGQNSYIIPEKENNISDADVLQTQIGSAIYGFPSAVPLLGENVYSVYENGTFKLGVRDNATGTYDWFHSGDPNAPNLFGSATDAAKWAMSKSQ